MGVAQLNSVQTSDTIYLELESDPTWEGLTDLPQSSQVPATSPGW